MNDKENIETPKMKNKNNLLLGSGMAVALATAAFFSGLHIGLSDRVQENMSASIFDIFKAETTSASEVDMSEFWQVWNLLDDKFVNSSSTQGVSIEEKIQGAISGLVNSYDDPYTVYLPPEDSAQFVDDISGNFSGVGMEVGMRSGLITVISPLPNTPADNAGILPGDVIVEIDGNSTKGMTIDDAVKLIRGEKGTDVSLKIYREEATDFLTITVTRDTITIPTIDTEKIGDTFVISLYNFNALSETKTEEALREYLNSDATSLVLDLRGNPGGFLHSAVAIAGYFLPSGKVVVRESFGENDDERVYRSPGRVVSEFSSDDLVVLVDGGSASAAEILAGALKAHGLATIIGEQTFGKGSVQELVKLNDDGSLKVTVARWLTPEGVSISDGGLEPNISIKRTAEDVSADKDPQLQAAFDWISGLRDFATATPVVE